MTPRSRLDLESQQGPGNPTRKDAPDIPAVDERTTCVDAQRHASDHGRCRLLWSAQTKFPADPLLAVSPRSTSPRLSASLGLCYSPVTRVCQLCPHMATKRIASQVHKQASRLIREGYIKREPAWYRAILDHPPLPLPAREPSSRSHFDVALAAPLTRPADKKTITPLPIQYVEDKLRRQKKSLGTTYLT